MSPQYDTTEQFTRDYKRLSPERRARFREAALRFASDLKAGRSPRAGLRVKHVRGTSDVYELTWDVDHDGRATFQYVGGERGSHAYVRWLRVGGHDIFDRP